MTAEEFKRRRDLIEKRMDSDEESLLSKIKPAEKKRKLNNNIKKKKKKMAALSFYDDEEEGKFQ